MSENSNHSWVLVWSPRSYDHLLFGSSWLPRRNWAICDSNRPSVWTPCHSKATAAKTCPDASSSSVAGKVFKFGVASSETFIPHQSLKLSQLTMVQVSSLFVLAYFIVAGFADVVTVERDIATLAAQINTLDNSISAFPITGGTLPQALVQCFPGDGTLTNLLV